jgi:lipoate-protein ligase B
VRPASRGGEVTYHGPGQLVAYPVIRLRRGVLAHVEAMANAVIDLIAKRGVRGEWRRNEPGVWIDDAKVCAVGVHVRRGVAVHGLALNVALPEGAFATIVPCGKVGGHVTSLDRHTNDLPGLEALAGELAAALADRFGLEFQAVSPESFG